MPERGRGWTSDLMRFAGLGIQLALHMVVLGTAGWFLDRWLDTAPWFLIGGALLGAVSGMWAVVRAVARDPQLGGRSAQPGGPRSSDGRAAEGGADDERP